MFKYRSIIMYKVERAEYIKTFSILVVIEPLDFLNFLLYNAKNIFWEDLP